MNLPHKTCDPQRLRLLLADQLPESMQAEVAEHLAQCPDCRQALESFAGDAPWWSEVESCLRANGEPASRANVPPSEPSSSAEAGSFSEARSCDESFAADFVVDFLEPCDQPEALGRLGEFEILEVIGRGGMGVVLKGFQRELGRYVAVKVMAPHLAASGAARQRFIREARAAAAVVHPHVMPIHAVCTSARLPYLVMPLVACESLEQRIDQGPLEVKEILRTGMQAAAGLAASHAQGLVHRDVKPANILLEKGVDRVLLTDFGLARAADDASLTRTGVVAGTPQYMSPEQSRGEVIDARSDLFSLGSVLYAMATGRPPFRAETTLGVLRRISDTQPRPIREINPDTPEWLERIIGWLHDKSPERRLASASQVAALLEQCLAHVQQPTAVPLPEACRASSAERVATPAARWTHSPAAWLAAAAIVLSILVAAIAGIMNNEHPTDTSSDGQVVEQPAAATGDKSATSLWHDGIAEELIGLHTDLESFETRAARPWDDDASSATTPSPIPSPGLNPQEIEP